MSGRKPFWKKQQEQPIDGGEAKSQETTRKDGGALYLNINSKTNRLETNQPDWQRSWEEIRIGKYGTSFKNQLDAREWSPFNLTERLADYPLQLEKNIDRDSFVPNTEQQDVIDALESISLRKRQAKIFCNDWQEERREINAAIKATNKCQETLRDVIAKEFAEYPDKVTMLFADINASMSEMSRLKVQAYKRGSVGDANYMNYESAVATKNWIWMFEAAEATHLMRGAEKDEVVLLERQQTEFNELKALYQGQKEFTKWLQSFDDKVRMVEAVGYPITDLETRVALMHTINPLIFEKLKDTWNSLLLRPQLPNTYDRLRDYVITTYSTIDQSLIVRARQSGKTESSFAAKERKDASKGACFICGASGREFHRWAGCPHYDPAYSMEQNAAYYARNAGNKQSSQKQEPEKVEIQSVCIHSRSQSDHEEARTLFTDEESIERSCVTLATKHFYQAGVDKDEIDFVLDTATETGASNSRGRELLQDLKTEHAALIGVGGHRVHVKEVGTNLFGKSRVVENSGAYNLVSQAECKVDWQIVNPSEDHIYLRGWKGKGKEHLQWDFYRNEERYGDKLLHCTLPKENFRVFLSTFHTLSLYKPPESPDESALTPEERESIEFVESAHIDLCHASAQALIRTVKAEIDNDVPYHKRLGICVEDINLWIRYRGKWCTGCILGKMTEHNRTTSTKEQESKVGEDGAADLLFVEQAVGGKRAIYTHTDIGSKCRFLVDMKGKTADDLKEAVRTVDGYHRNYGHTVRTLTFDRESAVVRIQDWLLGHLRIRAKLKAAHQKVGLAEIDIRLLKDGARATKAGVRERYGYNPPPQWNQDLVHHVNSCQNAVVRVGMPKSPAELFTGRQFDGNRDLRGLHWGQPVLAKKPHAGEASDLGEKAQWVIPVRVFRDGSGVVKVYVIDTKKFAHRFKFAHGKAPARIMEQLRAISLSEHIGFEDDEQYNHEEPYTPQDINFDGADVSDPGGVIARLENAEDVGEQLDRAPLEELYHQEVETPLALNPAYEFEDSLEPDMEGAVAGESEGVPTVEQVQIEPEYVERRFPTRVRKLKRLEDYVYAMTYEKAYKLRPESASKALNTELDNMERKDVWQGALVEELSIEEQGLVIDSMKNFKPKYLPTGEHEKDKVRILARGDKEIDGMLGETHGPVSRVESIFLLASIAVLKDYEVFKIDFVAAYLNTKMPEEVKHKWLLLDRTVSKLLCDRNAAYWLRYLRKDGRILVKMNRLLYGYKEAAHYWWKTLLRMFTDAGFTACGSDECVLTRRDGDSTVHIAVTVDDCFCVASDAATKREVIKLCRDCFQEITVEEGNELNIIGMNFDFDRVGKQVTIRQQQFIRELVKAHGVSKKSVTPALDDLYDEDPSSPVLSDQIHFMSINSSCMYAGKRTYPEILPATTYLASRYWKATEADLAKVVRVVEYLHSNEEEHALILRPRSLSIVASSDASYGEHNDGKSHTGGCVGLGGDDGGSFFIFVSSKQPVVAKSSCEAELISGSTVGDYIVWLQYMIFQLGYGKHAAVLEQDNTAAIGFVSKGKGSFKRSKHIKVRYFWLKGLVEAGDLSITYVKTADMIADILTKPLVGAKFRYLLRKLLGWKGDAVSFEVKKKHTADERGVKDCVGIGQVM